MLVSQITLKSDIHGCRINALADMYTMFVAMLCSIISTIFLVVVVQKEAVY